VSRHYAHSLPPPHSIEEWEPLEEHLQAVAELAGEFADRFGAADWGRVAGLWHDVGKYSVEFQDMLRVANGFAAHLETQPGRIDHATAGAQHTSPYRAMRRNSSAFRTPILCHVTARHSFRMSRLSSGRCDGAVLASCRPLPRALIAYLSDGTGITWPMLSLPSRGLANVRSRYSCLLYWQQCCRSLPSD
jgi:hypothetical protein